MKKKSKKSIPQDIRPWSRVTKRREDKFSMPVKQKTRWVAGSRRDRETRILSAAESAETPVLLLKSFTGLENPTLQQKLNKKLHGLNKMKSMAKHKNTCSVSGRARTFNRVLYLARHVVRKLVGVGLISGLIK